VAHFRTGTLLIGALPEYRLWLDRMSRFESTSPSERIIDNFGRAIAWYGTGDTEQFRTALLDALHLARQVESRPRQILAAWLLGILPAGPSHEAERRRVLFEALDWPQDEVSFGLSSSLLGWGSLSVLAWGDRDRAEDLWAQVEAMAQRTKEPRVIHLALVCRFLHAMADGRLEEAVEAVNTFKARAEEMGDRLLSLADGTIALTPFLHLGHLAEARVLTEGLTEFYDTGNRFVSAIMALTEALSDRPSEAAVRLKAFLAKGSLADRSAADLVMFLQVALILGDTASVRLIADELVPVAGDALVLGDATCVARHLGDASTFLGDVDSARRYYAQALDVATRIRFRPEIAMARLALAELLLGHYPEERGAAIDEFDFAIAELAEMKMRPALEHAARLRETAGGFM
jgi:hypothetical protein